MKSLRLATSECWSAIGVSWPILLKKKIKYKTAKRVRGNLGPAHVKSLSYAKRHVKSRSFWSKKVNVRRICSIGRKRTSKLNQVGWTLETSTNIEL